MTESGARARIERLVVVAVGVAAAAYTVVWLALAQSQFGLLTPGWGPLLYVLCSALPVLAGALAFLGRWIGGPAGLMRWARVVLVGYCCVYAFALLAWVPLMVVPTMPGEGAPWTWQISSIPTSAAAAILSARLAWAYYGGVVVATTLLRQLASPGLEWPVAVQDGLFLAMLAGILTLLIRVTLGAGGALDDAAAQARDAARSEAAARSTAWHRARLDALVHDRVLSVLLAAGRAGPEAREQIRSAARAALDVLDPAAEAAPISGPEMVARLRSVVPDGVVVTVDSAETAVATAAVPADVATALVEAAGEAARNSMRHAGQARREIAMRIDHGSVRITVADDGRGFEPAHVPPSRLGLRASIVDRMASLTGGRAQVHSRPGRGTVVTLTWTQSR
ncbi:sensor histidine kinase [Ruania alkalisoli]|uniref:Sensor histidine kinase n=1 Tax=Ruania alkalisoli TaxID=2779775 RepID=A0A7M1SWA2_9MICO|nr:ATP-binding protein [Ruania alkalisoli]QOR71327.1 sensor histidine kinase [Ruania alkalisoli]